MWLYVCHNSLPLSFLYVRVSVDRRPEDHSPHRPLPPSSLPHPSSLSPLARSNQVQTLRTMSDSVHFDLEVWRGCVCLLQCYLITWNSNYHNFPFSLLKFCQLESRQNCLLKNYLMLKFFHNKHSRVPKLKQNFYYRNLENEV